MTVFVLTRPDVPADRSNKVAKNLEDIGFNLAIEKSEHYGTLSLFHPLQGKAKFYENETGDYAFYVGLFIYKRVSGDRALELLLRNFCPGDFPWHETKGTFVCGVRKAGKLYIYNDALGVQKIYIDDQQKILSSSFMAVAYGVDRAEPDIDGCYQYAWNGAVFGERTFIRQIKTIRFNTELVLGEEIVKNEFDSPYWSIEEPAIGSLDECAEQQIERLRENFRIYADIFGDRIINTALSGGYDSRLILALLIDAGIEPTVFTYGNPTDKDVMVAKEICETLDLKLDISTNIRAHDSRSGTNYESTLSKNFKIMDSGGYVGSFGSELGIKNRFLRAKDSMILNGSLGEIYRLFFYFPDKKFAKRDVVNGFNYRLDPAACTEVFSEQRYCDSMEQAMGLAINSKDEVLEREQVEMIYPLFRGRYWTAQDCMVNQRFGPAVYPFMELNIVRPTYRIPISFKSAGRLEARMIAHVNPTLASIESDYGFSFDRNPTLKYLLSYYASVYRPVYIRSRTYRFQFRRRSKFPAYLELDSLSRVLDTKFPYMSWLFHLNKINDPQAYNRVATMEYILQHWR